MTPDPYLNAYETARTELAQITIRFDQLRARKSHIENLVVVLQQTLGSHGQGTIETQAEMEAMPSQHPQETAAHVAEVETEPENYSFHQVPSPSPLPESSGDPFERRVKTSFRFRGISAQRY